MIVYNREFLKKEGTDLINYIQKHHQMGSEIMEELFVIMIKLIEPTEPFISKLIPPNYSTWQTIELTYQCAKWVVDNNIPGDFVECGVAAGNNLAAMCKAGRFGYGFDSFEGIPWAGENDTQQPGIGEIDKSKLGLLESSGITVHTEENVRADFKKWGIENYHLIKGWFQDTIQISIPKLAWISIPERRPFKKNWTISVLRLDGDLYESTLVCLEHLYPLLSEGGILIIDDWNLEGCRKAFNDYFEIKNPTKSPGIDHANYLFKPKLIYDNGVTYWQK